MPMEPLTSKDLKRFKESTRRRLYELEVELIFGTFKETDETRDLIDLSPDDIELEIIRLHRRWFVKYVLPKTKSIGFKRESRWIMFRLYLDGEGRLRRDEV